VRAVWSCFRGLYADSPRALFEGLRARGTKAEHVWLCNEKTEGSFPAGVRTVRYPSPEAREALEAADLVVANDCLSMEWTKRPGTTYLQTWHGTPLKHIHHDVTPERPGWLDGPDRDVARWDHLLSPNAPSTGWLRHAFRYAGPVHETGYPRNDRMQSPHATAIRARKRKEYGIDDATTAVLYAPTWRDDLIFDSDGPGFEIAIDLADFARRLGDDHVLLVRLHSMISGRLHPAPGLPVVDVTDDTDSAGLYLAADLLVTDYSSAMFDFAITGKPLLFFTYDLHHFRDELRGFYFDLAEVAPGPLISTSEELIGAIADADTLAAEHTDRYARFRDTFCSLEDGNATDRVLDLLVPPGGTATGPAEEERG
jgi:CDP-glycerol glycerophosphotransferase